MTRVFFALIGALALLASPAIAADLGKPKRQQVADAGWAVPAPSWTGFWIGGVVGYDIDKQKTSDATVPFEISTAADAFTYGLAVGYDRQLSDHLVAGVSTDYMFTNAGKQSSLGSCPACIVVGDAKIDRTWYAGGRVGYLFHPKALGFVSLGYTTVYSNPFLGIPSSIPTSTGAFLGDRGGITYGGGLEVLSVHGFGLKLEYRFVDLGNDSLGKFSPTTKVEDNIHQVLLSANFKFNGPQ